MTKVLTGPPGPHPDDDGWDDDDSSPDMPDLQFTCLGGSTYPIIHREPVIMTLVGNYRLCEICDKIEHRTCKCCLPKEYKDPEEEPPLLD